MNKYIFIIVSACALVLIAVLVFQVTNEPQKTKKAQLANIQKSGGDAIKPSVFIARQSQEPPPRYQTRKKVEDVVTPLSSANTPRKNNQREYSDSKTTNLVKPDSLPSSQEGVSAKTDDILNTISNVGNSTEFVNNPAEENPSEISEPSEPTTTSVGSVPRPNTAFQNQPLDVPIGEKVPVAFLDEGEMTPQQLMMTDKIQKDFAKSVESLPAGSSSQDAWKNAKEEADRNYIKIFGFDAYNRLSQKAAIDALPEKRQLEPVGAP